MVVPVRQLTEQVKGSPPTNVGFESSQICNYRGYLQFLARVHLREQNQNRLDHSDIVQQSLLQAFAARAQFKGQTEAERLAWLRKILVHQVAHATRGLHTKMRDVKREQSIEAAMDQSSTRLAHFIVGRESTPSHNMVRQESARKIAEAIERLPTEQREVVILRYWEEKSLNDVSQALGKSTAAVAGLLHRATKTLRKTLKTDPN